ncbi:MAG: prolyl oligopeptidase family serine peptidase [Cyclobacteriaceae bacterium]|nr:prolyl oligopeptidase family serine peptidase [Cyclobacteriaceae bacterium]
MKNANQLWLLIIIGIISCGPQAGQEKTTTLAYPATSKVDTIDHYFNQPVPDPYRWLEDDKSTETGEWVKAQNKVTFDYLNNIDFREQMKGRLKQLLDYEKISAPFEEGPYEYWYKNDGLQNHSVLYRKKKGAEEEEVFLDPNGFSADGTVALRGVSFTKDGTLSGHMITEGGSDWRKIIVMNTATKTRIEDTLKNVKFSGLSWLNNEGFYYSSYDNPESGSQLSGKTQHHKLYYHKLETPQSEDVLVFGGEQQPNRYINGLVTEDQRYLIVSAAQNTSGNQLYIRDLNQPASEFILIQDDYFASCEYVDNDDERLYLYTNIDAPNYRLVAADLANPGKDSWVDVIPEKENVLQVSTAGGKIFARYLIDAKTAVFQYDMNGQPEGEINLPGIGTAYGFGGKKEDKTLYYSFTSFTYPTTIYKYNIAARISEEYIAPKVDFDPEMYETKQVFYKSKDGTEIPMFIVHKKGLELNGTNPSYLYAYGGFNISLTPGFDPYRILWLENGGIYAQPNLRGGGEYGEKWHEAGTKLNKQNVFDDFIAAGEHLISEKYTSNEYLAIAGGSNGGLLVGATMTQRPGLARVALPAVGVLDMLRYNKFTAGAGWAADYGTAEESEEMFNYLKKYSPYHALKEGVNYPATMVTTADHDDRVVPAHSFKFAARLQEFHEGNNPVLIRVQTNAGHGSVSVDQRIELAADRYAFIWYNMGVIPELAKEKM